MSRALVLGSGGQTGLAWEVGVLSGLAAGSVPISGWDLVLGSSAGAFVGARLTAGHLDATLDELLTGDPAVERDAMSAGMGNHLPQLLWLPGPAGRAAVTVWTLGAVARRFAGAARLGGRRSMPGTLAALRRFLGPDRLDPAALTALANLSVGLRQRQVPVWEAYWAGRLMPEREWPDAPLGVVAFCTSTGERRVFTAEDSVPLARAVAASTAVPGIVGAVEIGGRHHVDAGPADSTSADLAAGFDEVLVIAPAAGEGELEGSVRVLEGAGARVSVVRPSEPAALGDGIARLDVARVRAAARLGLQDGTGHARILRP